MFDFFQNKQEPPTDVKSIRHHLLLFIKDQLKRSEGGEGGAIRNMQLIIAPTPEDRHLYEGAIYVDEPLRLKEEVQKIADDYAIDLPEGWSMAVSFEDTLPPEAIQAESIPVALFISARKQALTKSTTALISVLHGEAESQEYKITSTHKKVFIGRDKEAQTPNGFLRINTIAFPSSDDSGINKSISRQHAHIEWNETEGGFYLYADDGGVPPRNKVKVQTSNGNVIKLQTTEIGHHLSDGDQIMLGDAALLGFNHILEEGEKD